MISEPQRRAEKAGIPYRAHVVVTHRCNLACEHCYQAEHAGPELTLAELEVVFDQLAAAGTLFLTIGGGEPLARRDLWEILSAAKRRRFAIELYTNGTMIDAGVARRLREAGVATVSVSLHGAHPETHDRFVRQDGAFDRIQRAIACLEAEGMPVTVKSNVTSTNTREVGTLARSLRTVNRPLVRLSINRHLHARDDGDPSPLWFAPDEAQLHAAAQAELDAGGPAMLAELLEGARSARARTPAEAPCQAARTTVMVQPSGDVTACAQLGAHTMGNVRREPLEAIWRGSAIAQRIRGVTKASFQAEHAECRTCPYRHVCSKCMALSEAESGSLTGHSTQVCRSTKAFWGEVRRRVEAGGGEWPA